MRFFKINGISGFKALESELLTDTFGGLGKAENGQKVRLRVVLEKV